MYLRFLAALLLLPLPALAQTYRWVDDSGKVHYSDQVPASGANQVQKRSERGSRSSSPPLPYVLQQALKDFPVTLYTSKGCNPCDQARELLNRRGVPYKDVDVADAESMQKLTGASDVPVMTVGSETYTGFESEAYQAALDNAGYPKRSQLPAGVEARQSAKPAAAPAQPPGANAPK